jgi:hypothetical protein
VFNATLVAAKGDKRIDRAGRILATVASIVDKIERAAEEALSGKNSDA